MKFKILAVVIGLSCGLAGGDTMLLRQPDIAGDSIVFVYANDLWIVDDSGGATRRLTSSEGAEIGPKFSPDGQWIAFSGDYDGNTDVYVVAADGGRPQRLTWHPGGDTALGWTADGSSVLFGSGRANAPRPWSQVFTIGLDGGMPERLSIPQAFRADLAPDGERLAYEQPQPWDAEWRYYRGGQAMPIRIVELDTLEQTTVPWEGARHLNPLWIGDTVFYLSDRDWVMNVWAYDTSTGEESQRTFFESVDCKNLGGGDGRLVFENAGLLWRLDAAGGEPEQIEVEVAGDFPWARPHWAEVGDQVRVSGISPSGKRALFEARGEVFTVPAKEGEIRNLSKSSGAADREPAWSPDGQTIAWFSDESGEYEIILADQYGERIKTINAPKKSFFFDPVFSPDSKSLAFADADRDLWIVDIESGEAILVANEGFTHPVRVIYPSWSPDSKWLAYTRRLTNQFSGVFVHSLDTGESQQISDGLSNAHSPAWDAGGKLLYFLASTDYGLSVGWLDMTSVQRGWDSSIWVAVLPADEPSPLAPKSDDEEAKDEESDEEKSDEDEDDDDELVVRIDFDGLDQRIISLDMPARSYGSLQAGKAGTLFFAETVPNEPGQTLHRYELDEQKDTSVGTGLSSYEVSADGSKLLLGTPAGWSIIDASAEAKGEGGLDLAGLRMMVDPAAEWQQIFREAWRFQRDYFYVDNVHGLDLDWAYENYAPWVEHVRHRADLNYILDSFGGETSVGHSYTRGGDIAGLDRVPVGLLGADFAIDSEGVRFARIFDGENWNPDLRSPLNAPGAQIDEGDYLVAVDGIAVAAGANIYGLFDHTADRQTRISVNDRPGLEGARELTVVPVASEAGLRLRAWVEDNRRRVDEASGGKLAYVWVPDTGLGGFTSFTRYFFAQQDRQGALIDERFNHGGLIPDYIVDLLSREPYGFFNNPIGDRQPFVAPNGGIWGPKVLLINEMSGSGGDILPYMFRHRGLGELIGTRTWGGLVGSWDTPPLVDGGSIVAPRGGFYDLEGNWAVENEGVAPDIEVERTPKAFAEGIDPQLEKAIEVAMGRLEAEALEIPPQPADPVRMRRKE